jgi:hypothetical protein
MQGATSGAPIFRIVDKIRGTLIFDEADFRFSNETSDIAKILNAGYQKNSPIARCVGDTHEVQMFNVFGPKILASRSNFHDDALESRCLNLKMDRVSVRKDIPRTLPNDFYKRAEEIRNKLLYWKLSTHYQESKLSTDDVTGVSNRFQQLTQVLLSVVDIPEHTTVIIRFIKDLNEDLEETRGSSEAAEIVRAIAILEKDARVVYIKEIAEMLNKAEIDFGRYITAKRVGDVLNNQLRIKRVRLGDGTVIKQCPENKEKLEYWKNVYGINKSVEVKGVDLVNIAEGGSIDPKKDLPKW